jgi:hypothetical protein
MEIVSSNITEGIASRFLKSIWVRGADEVQACAFDLRESPPEEYVSFFMISGADDEACFSNAFDIIGKKLTIDNGAVALLDIETCLLEVNDEDADIISFREKKLPHCGMYYHTDDLTKITEAKNTLRFLSRERIRWTSEKAEKLCLSQNESENLRRKPV